MKRLLSVTAPILVLSAAMLPLQAAPEGNHSEMLGVLKSEIAARPSRVLIAVEDALTMDEQGACEIVKTAITLTKADAKLVGQIVYTALKHSPGMSASIVECAVDTAPGAAGEIKTAMQKALGEEIQGEAEDMTEGSGKATTADEASGKESGGKQVSGKEPTGKGITAPQPQPATQDDWLDFGWFGGGIGSIYLTPPNSGLSPGSFIPPVTPEPDTTPDPAPVPPS